VAKRTKSSDIPENLNSEQKTAVVSSNGPILIVAGAGTGKTRVITARIAHLLSSVKGLKPENILALTFTDKATDEMRERVEGAVGEAAHDIWMFTFHAFCRKILAENGSHIGIPANFKIMDEVEKWIMLKRLLPAFKLNYYLQLADPAGILTSFVKFISRAKDELVLPEEYTAYAKRLRTKFNKAKKSLSREDVETRELEVTREEEVARIYNIYQENSLKERALDFGDLVLYTIKLFRKRPNILSHYREQFRYIMVDEFQDTNIAQIELLEMLSGKRKNICVVGDDDQAIYRFRGASYASFLKFREKFSKLKTVKLTQNYRSSRRILNSAGRLIANNGRDRYDPKKNLWTEKTKGPEVKALVASDYLDEARAVADEIEAASRTFESPNKFSNIAVLYRAHSHKDALLTELKSRSIPVSVVRGVGLLETEEIRDLTAYLKVINDRAESVSLFRVLTSPHWDVDIDDLISISNIASREEASLYDVIKGRRGLEAVKDSTRKTLEDFMQELRGLMRIAKRENAVEVLTEILVEHKYINRLIKEKSAANEQKVLNVTKFSDFVAKYLRNNPEDYHLSDFLSYLGCFVQAGGVLEQEALVRDEDAVRFMTVHSAKGLEFPCVFLIGLVQNRFPSIRRREPIPFPDALMKEKLPDGDFYRQEERRLCYVAMTRAKEALFLSGIDKPRNRPSMFLKEVLTEEAVEAQDILYNRIFPSEDACLRIKDIMGRFRKLEDRAGDYRLPKPRKLSFTQLDLYSKCPLQYKFAYVYRIPKKKRSHLTFGSDMHSTLEDFFTLVQERKPVDEKVLFELFNKHWTHFGYESRMTEANYKKAGENSLKTFYRLHKDMLHKPPLYLEKQVDLRVGDFVLDVRIDRIDSISDNEVEIIDYKTGKPKDDDFARESLQLSIYAMATKEVLKLEPTRVSFYYVNPNKKVTTTRSKEDFEKTKSQIITTGCNILDEKFDPNPGWVCKWCDYASICPVWDK